MFRSGGEMGVSCWRQETGQGERSDGGGLPEGGDTCRFELRLVSGWEVWVGRGCSPEAQD